MQRVIPVLIVVLCLLAGGAASMVGQDSGAGELVTDRPDFTESGLVVPLGSVQIEGGLLWERSGGDARVASGPELLVRWGVSHRLELRFGFPDYAHVNNHSNESGFGDGSFGAKIQLGPLGEVWDVASVVTFSIPTGESGFSTDGVDPSVILTTGRDLGNTWSVGSQVFGELASADNGREFVWGGTLVFGKSLGSQATTGTFLELAVTIPEDGDTALTLHHGYTRLLTENLQLDIHGGVGLNAAAPDLFFGAGMCFRR